MADAAVYRTNTNVRVTAAAAVAPGELRQLPSGLAGVLVQTGAAAAGDQVDEYTGGQFVVAKNPAIALLDGGRAYWDYTNARADYKRTANQRDYLFGRVVGDAPVGVNTALVQLNANPAPDYELARDPFYTTPIGTQALGGFLPPQRYGGGVKLLLSSTNQAQKCDALGKAPGWLATAPAIVEAAIEVVSLGSGSSPVLCVGIASGTHATAVTSSAQYLVCRVDGNANKIQFQSSDGTHTVGELDSTKTLTAGTRFEVWFDLRNPASVKLYVNGVPVLTGTAFDVSAAAAAWLPLAHLVKTATTDTFEADVDWLRVRNMKL